MQKTHAGQSCPLGPRTIPGGQSPSFSSFPGLPLPEPDSSLAEERSTGWLLLLPAEGGGGGGEDFAWESLFFLFSCSSFILSFSDFSLSCSSCCCCCC